MLSNPTLKGEQILNNPSLKGEQMLDNPILKGQQILSNPTVKGEQVLQNPTQRLANMRIPSTIARLGIPPISRTFSHEGNPPQLLPRKECKRSQAWALSDGVREDTLEGPRHNMPPASP